MGLVRRTFARNNSFQAKNLLYLSLIRSKLQYCSPLWHPQLIKNIQRFEGIQRRATKFILDDYTSDYKQRLLQLNLLPLMMQLEINDILNSSTKVSKILHQNKIINIFKTATNMNTYIAMQCALRPPILSDSASKSSTMMSSIYHTSMYGGK